MRRRSLLLRVLSAAYALGVCAGCGASSTSPSPASGTSMSGTWSGDASDSSGPGLMSWVLTQSGGTVSGTATVSTPLRSVALTGTFTGSLSGSNLTWTLDVPAGGVSGQPSCTVRVTGTAIVANGRTLTGSYTGTGSCTPDFTGGSITLSKN